ncbi:hypothetical protein [Bradyrhizobium genosp. SA-3]|uniref:hypothetical protein n=1 Tax=Bradyrhizobium genosp. SA-3 TaxID=508868 RepID=UPI00102987B9|nr:hypothetical protein [Bradyrhizobium genosp. SA-3]
MRRRARQRNVTFAAHLNGTNADHSTNAAGETVDSVTIRDVDGRGYPIHVGFRLGADGRELKAGDARLIEQPAEGGMHVAAPELQKKHRPLLPKRSMFVLANNRIFVPIIWVIRSFELESFWKLCRQIEWSSGYGEGQTCGAAS